MVAGIGDDCAIFRPPGADEDLLFTTDLLIEGVPFERATHSPAAVGPKALARGLSDIAAMGGDPLFCLVSLALPGWSGDAWVDRFYAGLLKLAATEGAVGRAPASAVAAGVPGDRSARRPRRYRPARC